MENEAGEGTQIQMPQCISGTLKEKVNFLEKASYLTSNRLESCSDNPCHLLVSRIRTGSSTLSCLIIPLTVVPTLRRTM